MAMWLLRHLLEVAYNMLQIPIQFYQLLLNKARKYRTPRDSSQKNQRIIQKGIKRLESISDWTSISTRQLEYLNLTFLDMNLILHEFDMNRVHLDYRRFFQGKCLLAAKILHRLPSELDFLELDGFLFQDDSKHEGVLHLKSILSTVTRIRHLRLNRCTFSAKAFNGLQSLSIDQLEVSDCYTVGHIDIYALIANFVVANGSIASLTISFSGQVRELGIDGVSIGNDPFTRREKSGFDDYLDTESRRDCKFDQDDLDESEWKAFLEADHEVKEDLDEVFDLFQEEDDDTSDDESSMQRDILSMMLTACQKCPSLAVSVITSILLQNNSLPVPQASFKGPFN